MSVIATTAEHDVEKHTGVFIAFGPKQTWGKAPTKDAALEQLRKAYGRNVTEYYVKFVPDSKAYVDMVDGSIVYRPSVGEIRIVEYKRNRKPIVCGENLTLPRATA